VLEKPLYLIRCGFTDRVPACAMVDANQAANAARIPDFGLELPFSEPINFF
jgi:hypothetical protein